MKRVLTALTFITLLLITWPYDSRQEAFDRALTIPGRFTDAISKKPTYPPSLSKSWLRTIKGAI